MNWEPLHEFYRNSPGINWDDLEVAVLAATKDMLPDTPTHDMQVVGDDLVNSDFSSKEVWEAMVKEFLKNTVEAPRVVGAKVPRVSTEAPDNFFLMAFALSSVLESHAVVQEERYQLQYKASIDSGGRRLVDLLNSKNTVTPDYLWIKVPAVEDDTLGYRRMVPLSGRIHLNYVAKFIVLANRMGEYETRKESGSVSIPDELFSPDFPVCFLVAEEYYMVFK